MVTKCGCLIFEYQNEKVTNRNLNSWLQLWTAIRLKYGTWQSSRSKSSIEFESFDLFIRRILLCHMTLGIQSTCRVCENTSNDLIPDTRNVWTVFNTRGGSKPNQSRVMRWIMQITWPSNLTRGYLIRIFPEISNSNQPPKILDYLLCVMTLIGELLRERKELEANDWSSLSLPLVPQTSPAKRQTTQCGSF